MSKKITDYDSAFAACEYALENISDFEGWCAAQERPKVKAKHLKAATKTLIGYVAENLPGSPRKVGEDGQPEKYERTHSRVWTNAWNAAIEECAKHLREGWSVANKDNGDDVMEVLMEELGGLMLPTPSIVGGPSSAPVGEQKQEEGV